MSGVRIIAGVANSDGEIGVVGNNPSIGKPLVGRSDLASAFSSAKKNIGSKLKSVKTDWVSLVVRFN
ncbi:hypothetical protein DP113_17065 [Brasilonema octagenarum UFV-E1]|uniref:Uncharacterized protein n=2 Tax=Brasilonema TaxID=383614 RepID=A0A856MJR1_9CYAN|nr:hypothetical protein [Brasilonema octagenarum UFV-OR1]QDL09397.1 hypothetical protein DP114_17130 [Brasilonema sennae CENA114]QDL15753.1 hypothetical protein DP113_17065 [Brasilonema octagenarum UFV-E1]